MQTEVEIMNPYASYLLFTFLYFGMPLPTPVYGSKYIALLKRNILNATNSQAISYLSRMRSLNCTPRHLASVYLFQYIVHHLIHSLFNKSFTSTFSKSEIRIKVSKSGWQVFVHHLEMVAWSLPNISANHLFECLVTANIIFNLFTSFFAIY